TFRRELEEEVGRELKLQVLKGLVHEFPISECVTLDSEAPASPANALYLRAYRVNGQAVRTENFIPPVGSEVRALHWLPFEQALKTIRPEGYRLLLESFARGLKKKN
ncbi:NUDIX hydrolase, partial [Candidatus Gottesmanbacteria bacterium]|nr:NUDIX hydrolase [Candidatus Gottesmanbacteria bacterium]